jgi:DNA-binding MarR family transcriptional regulator
MFFNDRMVAAMITIGESDRINLYQLAKKSHTNRTYIGHLTKRLEGLGMVKIDNSQGKRPVFVEATEKGRKVASLLKEASRDIWQEIAENESIKSKAPKDMATLELNPKYSLNIREAIDGYNIRIMNSEGTFTLNIDTDREKLRELTQQLSKLDLRDKD